MAQFDWRPVTQAGPQPPPCHGSPRMYDPGQQECRQCSFQNSCRDKIEAARRGVVPAMGQNFFQPAFQPAPQQQFQPAQQVFQPQPQMMPMMQNQFGQQMRPMQQPQVQMIPVTQEYYGRLQDPMHYVLAANPVPMRAQMPGETFLQRAFKNALLGFGEMFFFEVGKMFRQMVLPPPPQEIVVQPENKQIQQGR